MIKRFISVIFSSLLFYFETLVEMIYYIFTGKDDDCKNIIGRFLLNKNKRAG